MFKLINDPKTVTTTTIKKIATGEFIPLDTNNKDYREYLAWVALGNTPEPA